MRTIALALVVMAGVAVAGKPSARVVLADPDPELRRAMMTALAPWKLEVVIEPGVVDSDTAPRRADALDARFVVWRDGNDLVVFDRERNETTRRAGKSGTLDPVDAAAAALTVKTVMRLPDPDAPPPVSHSRELRVQAALETRIAKGSDTAVGGRFVGGVLVRPWKLALRFGAIADIDSSETVKRADFRGRWGDWAILGAASYTLVRDGIEIEPYGGIGIGRSTLEGSDMDGRRTEHEVLGVFRVGTWVRWRSGMWTIGGTLSFEAIPGTPTYTKVNNGSVIYEVPSSAVSLGVVVAADLGR